MLVTGDGRGIGRSLALGLAAEGMQVVPAAGSGAEIDAVAEEIRERDGEAVAVPTDVTDTGDVTGLFERTRPVRAGRPPRRQRGDERRRAAL